MKRFYKLVSLHSMPGSYAIHLDGRPVKTPMGKHLLCENENLAGAVQGEWAAQEESIKPDSMPLTQLLSTQLDQVAENRASMSAEVLKYLDTDLLCYRAGDNPPGMGEAQAAAWDIWLQWFENRYGCALKTTTDLAALTQLPAAHKGVKVEVESMNDARFTVLQLLVPLSGSVVLGLAFAAREIDPQTLYQAIRVEENIKAAIYNEELYGMDPAQEQKEKSIKKDLEAAARFLDLIS